MVFDAPVSVTVPLLACSNAPEPLVERLPDTLRLVMPAAVIPAPENVRLKKLLLPVPLKTALAPVKITVEVFPLNVPLFIQLVLKVCANVLALNVDAASSDTFMLTVKVFPAVKVTPEPVPTWEVKLPAIVIATTGIVLTAVPFVLSNVRLP